MELHSSIALKKLCSHLRVAFFMMRKGLIPKRKLIMEMNLMMNRWRLVGKSLGNLTLLHHHHHHHHSRGRTPRFALREYEFSCSNSPNPVFFHAKRRHNYFPCISAIAEEPDETPRPVTFMVQYSPQCSRGSPELELAPETRSPLGRVRVSNYSSEDEDDAGTNREVDAEAEEFIRRFYEQLRVQTQTACITTV